MTVAQLIAELQRMPPQLPVRVLLPRVCLMGEQGDFEQDLNELDATEADDVRHSGAYVLITGR